MNILGWHLHRGHCLDITGSDGFTVQQGRNYVHSPDTASITVSYPYETGKARIAAFVEQQRARYPELDSALTCDRGEP